MARRRGKNAKQTAAPPDRADDAATPDEKPSVENVAQDGNGPPAGHSPGEATDLLRDAGVAGAESGLATETTETMNEGTDDGEAEELAGEAGTDTAAPGQRDPDGQAPGDAAPAEPEQAARPRWPERADDMNAMAATAAACIIYPVNPLEATPETAFGWIGGTELDIEARGTCAAGFLRDFPEAGTDAVLIHMRMKGGFRDVPPLDHRRRAAWMVFRTTLAALDACDRAEKAEAEAAAKAAEAAKGPAAQPRSRLANLPPDRNPLTQVGRVLAARGDQPKGR